MLFRSCIIAFALGELGIILFYFTNPFMRPVPVWLLVAAAGSDESYNLVSFSVVCLYFPVIFIGVLLCYHHAVFMLAYSTYQMYTILSALKRVANRPESPESKKSSPVFPGLAFRQLQLLTQHLNSVIRPFLSPFSMFTLYAAGVALNFICIRFHSSIPMFMFPVCVTISSIVLVVFLTVIPGTANINAYSRDFVTNWTKYVRAHYTGENLL